MENVNNIFTNNNNNNNNLNKFNNVYRSTYGAYTTFPRGPYLQYKIKDQNQSTTHQHNSNNNNDNNNLSKHHKDEFYNIGKKTNSNNSDNNDHKTHIIQKHQTQLKSYPCNLNEKKLIEIEKQELRLKTIDCHNDMKIFENNYAAMENFQNGTGYQTLPNKFKLGQIGTDNKSQSQQHNHHFLTDAAIGATGNCVGGADIISSSTKELLAIRQSYRNEFFNDIHTTATYKTPTLFYTDETEIKSKNLMGSQMNGKKNLTLPGNEFLAKNYDSRIPQNSLELKYIWNNNNNEKITQSNAMVTQTDNNLQEFRKHAKHGHDLIPKQFITLGDVLRVKPKGLNRFEGWAFLCQSVQALQDLFLSDMPSAAKILPLVRSATIKITPRGRIVFNLTDAHQLYTPNEALMPGEASYFDITAHLSPEYLNNMGKRTHFSESEVEKMWIYSLGITIQKAIRTQIKQLNSNSSTNKFTPKPQQINRANNMKHEQQQKIDVTTYLPLENCYLEQVVASMCEHDYRKRASLMYLLDLNPERTTLRRAPQQINSLNPQFDNNSFNFTKVKCEEILLEIVFEEIPVTFLINKSPLSKYHSLICPEMLKKNPQKLTFNALYFCIKFLSSISDSNFRIGFNSPGALASVNHLHLHLVYANDLFVESVVISNFFRLQHQVKPFSHVVMDLFSEVVSKMHSKNVIRFMGNSNDSISEGTDSGRGSDFCENAVIKKIENLKVVHNKAPLNFGYDKFSVIAGTERPLNKLSHLKEFSAGRRRHNQGKTKDFRRNTIDVNIFDLQKASREVSSREKFDQFISSKSTECLDKIASENARTFAHRLDNIKLCDNSPGPDVKNHVEVKHAIKKYHSEENFLSPSIRFGPEFIIKSSLPSKRISLCDTKNSHRKRVHILLLNGQSIYIDFNVTSTTIRDIFEAIILNENYYENFVYGLCTLNGGDFIFLPLDMKIHKVAPENTLVFDEKNLTSFYNAFTLFLRVKFLLPSLRGLSSIESCHNLYLQLRKTILERNIICTLDDLIILGGLALQAELGDFKQCMKYSEYFTVSHYLPENFTYNRKKEMIEYLKNSHYCRQGLDQKEAEQIFIKYVQRMKEYGFHLYSAIWSTEESGCFDVYVGIALYGIAIFERKDEKNLLQHTTFDDSKNSKTLHQRKLFASFEWLEIENLCYSKHILCIVVRKTESLKAKDNNRIKYKLRMSNKKSYFAFCLASEHHQFYMRLRNSFSSLKVISSELNIPIRSQEISKKDVPFAFTCTAADGNNEAKQTINDEFKIKNDNNKNLNEIKKFTQNNKIENENQTTNTTVENQLGNEKQSKNVMAITTEENCTTKSTKNNNNNNSNNNVSITITNGGNVDGRNGGTLSSTDKKPLEIISHQEIRGKNVKKSMLNDNRLLKLREKFLKRSKSSVGFETGKPEKPVKDKKSKTFKDKFFNKKYSIENLTMSNEQNQNKENENPKILIEKKIPPSPTKSTATEYSLDDNLRVHSPNRNRVKMGTRVFSSSIKSFDNLFETNSYDGNEIFSRITRRTFDEHGYSDYDDIKVLKNKLSLPPERNYELKSDDNDSCNNFEINSNAAVADAAYVIYSGLNGDNTNDFSLQNESISQSLLEKFNNISTVIDNERILLKLVVNKELVNEFLESTYDYESDPLYETLNRNDLPDKINQIKVRSQGGIYCKKISRSQDSLKIHDVFRRNIYRSKLTLGISIVQGLNDNNVYVKDLIKNGAGEKAGIQKGDQIMAVNGISLLNLPYNESLELLQNTGPMVELIIAKSQNNKNYIVKNSINQNFNKNFDEKINCNNSTKYKQNKNNINFTSMPPPSSLSSTTITSSSSSVVKSTAAVALNYNLNNYIIEKNDTNNYGNEENSKNIIKDKENDNKFYSNTNLRNFNQKLYYNNDNNAISNYQSENMVKNENTTNYWGTSLLTKHSHNFPKVSDSKSIGSEEVYATVLKKSQRQRKYQGPVKFPVTPLKPDSKSRIVNSNFSLPVDDEKVII